MNKHITRLWIAGIVCFLAIYFALPNAIMNFIFPMIGALVFYWYMNKEDWKKEEMGSAT